MRARSGGQAGPVQPADEPGQAGFEQMKPGTRALACGERTLLLNTTKIMAVLNVTPDSFSDGGRFQGAHGVDVDAVRRTAESMLAEGADLLDVGGESTRPGATAVRPDEELNRVMPVLESLLELDTIVSVDTSKAAVAREALAAGCHMINDVTGLVDGGIREVLAG